MSYQTPSEGPTYAVPNSSMAIISLVSGILGLTFVPFIGSVVAVITGPMAKREIRESGGTQGGEGLATAGIILGWIGIALGLIGICAFGTIFALPLCLVIFNRQVGSVEPLLSALLAVL